ncbi:MAG TPA: ankyrin repeat domain-containing protein [Polyangiaceae bacterium]|nr:ankyrin repeat domain-containing protein [Polyangiaceae bacterium]
MFEAAVDAVISGDLATLETLLRQDPTLVRARSSRPHGATLLHYVAANGVEDERQKTPPNIVAITKLLLQAGAEVDAEANLYGGGAKTLGLLVSSVHPHRAGLQVALVDVLVDAGATLDGALLTALEFVYPAAADALVRRGAKVDTLLTAAGLGRLDLVERFLDGGAAKAELEHAFILACRLDRVEVADRLLRHGVDPSARDKQGFTGLHWAAWYGYMTTLERLLERHAPLEIKNEYGGTVLGTVVWAAANADTGVDYAPVIERLIRAGAMRSPQ